MHAGCITTKTCSLGQVLNGTESLLSVECNWDLALAIAAAGISNEETSARAESSL